MWGSLGACAAAMLVEPWLVGRQRRAIEQSLRDQFDAQAAEADPMAPPR